MDEVCYGYGSRFLHLCCSGKITPAPCGGTSLETNLDIAAGAGHWAGATGPGHHQPDQARRGGRRE